MHPDVPRGSDADVQGPYRAQDPSRRPITDDELDAIAAGIRRHRRMEQLGRGLAVGVVFVAFAAGCTTCSVYNDIGSGEGGAQFFWIVFLLGCLAAGWVYRRIAPQGEPPGLD